MNPDMCNTVFEVTLCRALNCRRPHYPSCRLESRQAGIAGSLVEAEAMIRRIVREDMVSDIHHFDVREIPVGIVALGKQGRTNRVYDRMGELLDRSLCSSLDIDQEGELGIFPGRPKSMVRFHEGDIVEVAGLDELTLGFVVGIPTSVEMASNINNASNFTLDWSDDSYTILTDSTYWSHEHVGALALFKPQFKMHPRVEERLHTAWRAYVSAPMKRKIKFTAATEILLAAAREAGLTAAIRSDYLDEGMEISIREGLPEPMTIMIPDNEALDHTDRVAATLRRLAGLKSKVRGYSLHKLASEQSDITWYRIGKSI